MRNPYTMSLLYIPLTPVHKIDSSNGGGLLRDALEKTKLHWLLLSLLAMFIEFGKENAGLVYLRQPYFEKCIIYLHIYGHIIRA